LNASSVRGNISQQGLTTGNQYKLSSVSLLCLNASTPTQFVSYAVISPDKHTRLLLYLKDSSGLVDIAVKFIKCISNEQGQASGLRPQYP